MQEMLRISKHSKNAFAFFEFYQKMNILFIEARKRLSAEQLEKLENSDFSMLPEKIGLVSTVQYLGILKKIQTLLEAKGKKVFIAKSKNLHKGQVIGCDTSSAEGILKHIDCFLLVGNGAFHSIHLSKRGKQIFILQPETASIIKYSGKNEKMLSKFFASENVGILVCTKPGQFSLNLALHLRKMLKNKNSFLFLFDAFNESELENFKMDSWINTACPGIALDSKLLINYSELKGKI